MLHKLWCISFNLSSMYEIPLNHSRLLAFNELYFHSPLCVFLFVEHRNSFILTVSLLFCNGEIFIQKYLKRIFHFSGFYLNVLYKAYFMFMLGIVSVDLFMSLHTF